jgi:hypothetical protein
LGARGFSGAARRRTLTIAVDFGDYVLVAVAATDIERSLGKAARPTGEQTQFFAQAS